MNHSPIAQSSRVPSKVESFKSTSKLENEVESEDTGRQSLSNTLCGSVLALKHFIHTNDPHRLKRFFASNKSKDEIKWLANARDDAGKSPLDIAACLGRVHITKLLILHGAKVDSSTSKGYTCLHHAAAWGQLPVLKILVENGANIHKQNIHGETPMDIAMRYNQVDCFEYLDILVQKKILQTEVTNTLERFRDIDKLSAGRITKDEKNMVIGLCLEIQEWLETTSVTTHDISVQLAFLIQSIQPVFNKLSESSLHVKLKRHSRGRN